MVQKAAVISLFPKAWLCYSFFSNQGFFVSVFYCFLNSEVSQGWGMSGQRWGRLAGSQLACCPIYHTAFWKRDELPDQGVGTGARSITMSRDKSSQSRGWNLMLRRTGWQQNWCFWIWSSTNCLFVKTSLQGKAQENDHATTSLPLSNFSMTNPFQIEEFYVAPSLAACRIRWNSSRKVKILHCMVTLTFLKDFFFYIFILGNPMESEVAISPD